MPEQIDPATLEIADELTMGHLTSILDKILSTVILDAALVVFILSAVLVYRQHRNRVKASINLIYQYAKEARGTVKDRGERYKSTCDQIIEGNPYGEPAGDYTPLLVYNKEYELSFEQISEILRYLKKEEQELLLKYFSAQSTIDAYVYLINTDYFRTVPQKRKAEIIKKIEEEIKVLGNAADNLIKAFEKRGNI